MELIPVGGARLEVDVRGSGEPADELRPLATQPALRDGYRTVLYHRRGYAGSSRADGPGSITRDVADCRAVLDSLGQLARLGVERLLRA